MNKTYETAEKIKIRLEATLNSAKKVIDSANKILATATTVKEDAADSDDDGGTYFDSAANPKIFGENPSETHNCGGPGAGSTDSKNIGLTLISNLTCLCIRSQSAQKLCDKSAQSTTTGILAYASDCSACKIKYAALIKKCPKKTQFTTTEDLVRKSQRFHALTGGNPVR
ncbi:Trypanosomal VSG domain containing protein, putative [Trypanosoma equiperdum]|uniref:Trypanosomal VSG domain containing protein, putative n=1 Tax=Trypanosoma equiperdum TaxID=5694 RepID=A0A1G4ICF1_TRYEQ|nr:Trypanosomal VSG domain containing protein, putative [Trypanosoma equiperdum]